MNVTHVPMTYVRDWEFVRNGLGLKWAEDTRGIASYNADTGERLSVVVFNNWTWSSVHIHMEILNPLVLRHGLLQEIYKFAFITGGKLNVVGMVPDGTPKATKLNKHIGLTEVARIPEGYAEGKDYIVMQGTREDLKKWEPKSTSLEEVA